jgi:hypothetical protein
MLGSQGSSDSVMPVEAPERPAADDGDVFGNLSALVSENMSNDVLVENALSWLLD